MSEQGLKPCPFCGKKPDVIEYSSYGSIHYRVQCHACGTGTRSVLAKARLSILWNTRHPDPMLEELANRLNNCLVLLEDYQGANADMKMIEKSRLSLQKYQQSKVKP